MPMQLAQPVSPSRDFFFLDCRWEVKGYPGTLSLIGIPKDQTWALLLSLGSRGTDP